MRQRGFQEGEHANSTARFTFHATVAAESVRCRTDDGTFEDVLTSAQWVRKTLELGADFCATVRDRLIATNCIA